MNNPILSWGDTEETPIMAKARQSVNALDTTDAVNEMDEQARHLEEQRQLRGIGAIDQPTTDALLTQAKKGMVLAFKFEGQRFDCGSIDGFVKATNYFYDKSIKDDKKQEKKDNGKK